MKKLGDFLFCYVVAPVAIIGIFALLFGAEAAYWWLAGLLPFPLAWVPFCLPVVFFGFMAVRDDRERARRRSVPPEVGGDGRARVEDAYRRRRTECDK